MRQVVCIAAEPWTVLPTRTQQLMTRLEGAQVLYFVPPAQRGSDLWKRPGRKLRDQVIVYTLPPMVSPKTPLSLISHRDADRAVRFLQSKLEKHRFLEPVLWCSTPAGARFLDAIAYRGLVYDCYRDWPRYPESWESELAAESDVAFAASPDLVRHLSPCNSNVTLLPFGCNYPMFAKDDLKRPPLLREIEGPTFGYTGTLWPDLDLSPLIHLAVSRPDCNIVLVGHDAGCYMLPELISEPNVHVLGPVAPVDLPDYLCSFDVNLFLLRRGRLYDDVIPPRMFEYLSAGKPIVAMLRPDQVEHFPDVVYAAHSPAEFSLLCTRALAESGDYLKLRRREYGKAAAWSERAKEVNQILTSIGLFT